MTEWIYYDSKTGNVERFIQKLKAVRNWNFIKISEVEVPVHAGHLISFTTRFGEVPETTAAFMRSFSAHIETISISGNRNWGTNFAKAADKLQELYHLPILMKFELSGTQTDVQQLINKIEARYDH